MGKVLRLRIKVVIIPYLTLTRFLNKSLRLYSGLYEKLCNISPDIIFIHGTQSYSMFTIIKYKINHKKVRLFADQHGDFYNMPLSTIKQKLINKYIAGIPPRIISYYVEKFWGVTPWRVEYLHKVYGINPQKTGLLVMGGDESKIDFKNKSKISNELRKIHNINENDLVIITGGKINKAKNIHLLVEAVKTIRDTHLKLVIFGTPSNEMKGFFDKINDNKIVIIGWIPSSEAYNWFLTADLAVFPGTHSVLWEQAVACGIPCVFKFWEGMTHVDIGGNCEFLYHDDVEEIRDVIKKILSNEDYFRQLVVNASRGISEFSYLNIAKKSIGMLKNDDDLNDNNK